MKTIINAIETEPKSITDIQEETGRDRKAISTYCQLLADTGLIKGKEAGNKKLYWRYTLSDRQTGLELRGVSYRLSKMEKSLEESRDIVEQLIEKSNDSVKVLEADE